MEVKKSIKFKSTGYFIVFAASDVVSAQQNENKLVPP